MVAERASAVLGEVALDVPCTAGSLPLVRSVVRSVVDFDTFDERSGFLVAVSEIFTNSVAAQQRADVHDPILVAIGIGDEQFVRIDDRGEGFPGMSTDSVLIDPDETGRGLLIAWAFVPDLSIRSSTAGTSVTLPVPPS